jgi:hypothetical protein
MPGLRTTMTRLRMRDPAGVAVVAAAGVLGLAGCGGGSADSGGLTAHDRTAAQSAMDELRTSNIPLQLVAITRWVQEVPAACRIRLVSRDPETYKVYVFWIPYLAAEPYVWLNMRITGDPSTSTFRLGTSEPVLLPGGRLSSNGQAVNPRSVDTTVLSRYGPKQAKKSRDTLVAHGGDVFAKPGARCQLLADGSLRLLPNR